MMLALVLSRTMPMMRARSAVMIVSLCLATAFFIAVRMPQRAENAVYRLQGDSDKGNQNSITTEHGRPFPQDADCN
jgi:hypothetical protein